MHIRYLSNGNYEIEVPGRAWDTLIPIKGMSPPSDFQYQPASSAQNAAGLFTGPARWGGYKYSEYAFWYSRDVGRQGWVAFGSQTAAADIPRSGSATYDGVVHGSADIMSTDPLSAPFYYPAQVDGDVSLAFDFDAGNAGRVDDAVHSRRDAAGENRHLCLQRHRLLSRKPNLFRVVRRELKTGPISSPADSPGRARKKRSAASRSRSASPMAASSAVPTIRFTRPWAPGSPSDRDRREMIMSQAVRLPVACLGAAALLQTATPVSGAKAMGTTVTVSAAQLFEIARAAADKGESATANAPTKP